MDNNRPVSPQCKCPVPAALVWLPSPCSVQPWPSLVLQDLGRCPELVQSAGGGKEIIT